MIAGLHRLGLTRVDRALPAHHVATGWPTRRWLVIYMLLALLAALAASYAWLYQRERDTFAAFVESQTAADKRITVAFEGEGIVCKVPADRAAVAPIIHDTCQMAVRLIAAREASK